MYDKRKIALNLVVEKIITLDNLINTVCWQVSESLDIYFLYELLLLLLFLLLYYFIIDLFTIGISGKVQFTSSNQKCPLSSHRRQRTPQK